MRKRMNALQSLTATSNAGEEVGRLSQQHNQIYSLEAPLRSSLPIMSMEFILGSSVSQTLDAIGLNG